jgi:hypothetical protein
MSTFMNCKNSSYIAGTLYMVEFLAQRFSPITTCKYQLYKSYKNFFIIYNHHAIPNSTLNNPSSW